MFDSVQGRETTAGDRLGSFTAALHASAVKLADLTADMAITDGATTGEGMTDGVEARDYASLGEASVGDAALIEGLAALEAAKAACAAAQARLTRAVRRLPGRGGGAVAGRGPRVCRGR